MKIGIITYHRALNYGAVLQAYALQQYLKKLDIDSEIIDYRCPFIELFYKPIKASLMRNPKLFVRELLYYRKNRIKRARFEGFLKKNVKTSQIITDRSELTELQKEYDCLLTGSDQVWNLNWSGFDKAYFLDFCDSNKKYSYAASFGFDKIPDNERDEYKTLLQDFQGLSVRESSGKEIIKDLLLRDDCVTSPDPTCLLSAKEWEKVAIEPRESGYVLVYTLEKSQELIDYAIKLAAEKNLKLIYIADALKKTIDAQYKGFMDPAEFVGLFMRADYVVTNSFHGLMFSVIFEKDFYLAYQKKPGAPNARLADFIKEYSLENRVLSGEKEIFFNRIEYNKIKEKMIAREADAKTYMDFVCNKKNKDQIVLPSNKDMCCGCRACEQICPTGAIKMVADSEGFIYPEIDQEKCVRCRKCIKTCSFSANDRPENVMGQPEVLVGFHRDDKVRINSRSGGIFVALSDKVLEENGVVYGADFNNDFSVSHKRATQSCDRNRFCGSKYVQSDTEKTFMDVLRDLLSGRKVLYSGTGCQIGGLIDFLNNCGVDIPWDNLVTVDIICHGVMSPRLWQDNLRLIRKKNDGVITAVNFRDKSFGWDSHVESYIVDDKKVTSTLYTATFYEHQGLRPSCYVCPYSCVNRKSDITIADAWGIKQIVPEWDSSKGVSLVLIHSKKGKCLLNEIGSVIESKCVDLEGFMQPNMTAPTKRPATRDEFWKHYNEAGFEKAALACMKRQNYIKRKNQFKAMIVRFLRKLHLR